MNARIMLRTIAMGAWLTTSLLLSSVAIAEAQQAMTVVGHVTSQGKPLRGARVSFDQLRLERTTDETGRYSFVIPSSYVRGQAVTLTARMDDRHLLYGSQAVEVVLGGAPVVQDFTLPVVDRTQAASNPLRPQFAGAASLGGTALDIMLDPAQHSDAENVQAALVATLPGLDVRTSAAPGGTSVVQFRGPRSLVGTSQPLFVLDGVPLDNTSFRSSAQRAALGGFDYGSPLDDIDLANIASVSWLPAAEAAARFGGRAANGVVLLASRRGDDVLGLSVSASQQVSAASPLALPDYQNAYGQGLNGKFQFLDGRGGGINDNIDQSWGPALDGRPLQQASLTEAGQADVRLWSPRPDNVRDYFRGGRTTSSNASIQRGAATGAFRLFFNARDTRGVMPENGLIQRSGGASVTLQPTPALAASATALFGRTTNFNAPGTGVGEDNTVAQFARTGRQVDIIALRDHLRDTTGRQISWSYSGHNNPYFAAVENSNESRRTHKVGSASATYAAASWLTATVHGGIDDISDARRLTIAPGWVGGFSSIASANGDYTLGGRQDDEIGARRTSGDVSFEARRVVGNGVQWSTMVGADHEALRETVVSVGSDSAAVLTSNTSAASWEGSSARTGAFARTGISVGELGGIYATMRQEWTVSGMASASHAFFPAVNASVDLTRLLSASRNTPSNGVVVHASWARTAGELTPYDIQAAFRGATATGSMAPRTNFSGADSLTPEVTTAAEAGITLSASQRRLSIGATLYAEHTDDAIISAFGAALPSLALHSGRLSNRGVETHAGLHLGGSGGRAEWHLVATAARNMNQVDSLQDAAQAIAFGPTINGVSLQARVGQPLGALVGTKLLRDGASGELLLRNGLPLPDSVAGPQQLGVSQPTWVLGLRNSFRYRWVTLSMVGDAHVGGSVFSATQMWGTYAGTLQSTAFRPDSGLLISGRDVVTGTANTQHATAQDYYHAIGSIQEPWVVSATYARLTEARLSLALPTSGWNLPFESASVSLVGRNLVAWSRIAGLDPEAQFGAMAYSGIELGQVPYARSIGVQLSIAP